MIDNIYNNDEFGLSLGYYSRNLDDVLDGIIFYSRLQIELFDDNFHYYWINPDYRINAFTRFNRKIDRCYFGYDFYSKKLFINVDVFNHKINGDSDIKSLIKYFKSNYNIIIEKIELNDGTKIM